MNSAQSPPRPFFGKNVTNRQLLTRSFLGVALSLLVLAGLGFFRNPSPAHHVEEAEPATLPVETVVLEPVTQFVQSRTYTGLLKASRTSELGFERTGRLIAVEVNEGDRVQAGQVLAQLDVENLHARQQELTARRAAAQSVLEELEAGPREQTIAAARAEVADLQSQLELALLNFDRRQQLLQSQAISREEYDRTSLGLKSAEAKRDVAQRRLDELEAGTRPERVAAQQATVAQLDAALDDVAVNIEESTLLAPYAGVIGKRYLDEGTIVAPGAPLVRLLEDEQLEAWIGVPAELAAELQTGQSVKLSIARRDYAATVGAILPELDPATRTRTTIFRLESADGVLPAQVARVEITSTVAATGFWVPTTALARGSRGLWSVLVAEPAAGGWLVAARRDVEVLHTDGQRTLVRGTLAAGDQVIVVGAHRVASGQPITQKPASDSS